jgi:multiple sugar transport system permease protein
MVPNVVTMIPLYLIMRQIGWVDTWAGLLAPYVLGSPYGIFLMRQFFRTLPKDLEDAARIDGAGVFSILWRIILPLSKPILGTLTILTVVFSWHNFLWPLVITSSDGTKVVTVGIASLQGNLGADYNLMMAASFVALVPLIVVFLIFQRTIVRSVVLSGLK